MTGTDPLALLDPNYRPNDLHDRQHTKRILTTAFSDLQGTNFYLYGPRGTGKTHLVEHALSHSPSGNSFYIPCITHDTQYKVLEQMYTLSANVDLNPGYHTAQLQDKITQRLSNTDTMVILDEVDFLLENDGGDLLYFLSRLNRTPKLNIVAISANLPSLSGTIDERTYSSLRPRTLHVEPYSEETASDILEHRAEKALSAEAFDTKAINQITSITTNLKLGLCWLTIAAEHSEDVITHDVIWTTQTEAVQFYRNKLLTKLTPHHQVLLAAVDQLTNGRTSTYTGQLYDRYTDLCNPTDYEPLTARRISDYISHLDFLNLITVTHHPGGETGKTREIRLTPLEEL